MNITTHSQKLWTYKCFVLTSISKPGVVPFPLETGIVPDRLLSDRSSQKRFDRLPIEGGILPMKLLELRYLQGS